MKFLKEIDLSKQQIVDADGIYLLYEVQDGILALYEYNKISDNKFEIIRCFDKSIHKIEWSRDTDGGYITYQIYFDEDEANTYDNLANMLNVIIDIATKDNAS